MSQYVIYDPTSSIDKLFLLPHKCEKNPDKIVNQEKVILVEDANLERLLTANKGHISAIFVTKQKSAQDYRKLKASAAFVLEMPPKKEEVEALAAVLSGNILTSELDMSETLPPELLTKYEESICDKLEEVENLIQEIAKNPTKELLEGLRNSVHKFAGNAASYGYVAATPLCRAHEAFLESCYDSIPKEKLLKANEIFFRTFRLTMQKFNLAPAVLK